MTPTHTPVTFNGQIVNLQIVYGGSPTINNYPQLPTSSRSARPTPHSSRPGSPSASSSLRASSTVQGRSSFAASQEHHVQAAAPISFPSPHPEPCPSTASLLSPLGSPMENLNGLRARTLVTTDPRQFNAAEVRLSHITICIVELRFPCTSQGRIHQYPSPVEYISHAGDLHLREYDRVDNHLSHRDDCTANMYRSSPHIPFPMPCLPPYSFPVPSSNLNVWSVPGPDRCDWCIDEREERDYSDNDEGYH